MLPLLPPLRLCRYTGLENALAAALLPKPSRRVYPYPRTPDGAQEAHLIAWPARLPPEGKRWWTVKLLAARLVELD